MCFVELDSPLAELVAAFLRARAEVPDDEVLARVRKALPDGSDEDLNAALFALEGIPIDLSDWDAIR